MEKRKSVLITGCSAGGIGDALAQSFHSHGFRVFATARNLSKVAHLKELGIDVIELDVTNEESVKKAAETVSAATQKTLDVLVNNSGSTYSMPLLDIDIPTAQAMFETNVWGVMRMIQVFSPLLIASKGTIINNSSVAAYVPSPFLSAYNMTKASLTMMSNTLRYEMTPFDVKVIVLTTGRVVSKVLENQPEPTLPPNSLYDASKARVESAMSGKEVEHMAIDGRVFADKVVKNAMKRHPTKELWAGGRARSVWWSHTFLGSLIWDFLMPSIFGLDEFAREWKKQNRGT